MNFRTSREVNEVGFEVHVSERSAPPISERPYGENHPAPAVRLGGSASE
jgi:hypothetical protein